MKQTASWFLLFLLGIAIMIIGITGSLGKLVAIVFSPAILTLEE